MHFCHILLLKITFLRQNLIAYLYIFFSIYFKSVFFNITFDAWNYEIYDIFPIFSDFCL